jgi:hypothetical protein
MARANRFTSWVVPFAVGLIIGLLIDFALKVGGGLNWVLVAIPFGAAAVTVVGSLVAEVFREGLQEDADRQRRLELHAESLSENALVWLQNLVFVSDLWQREPRQVSGLCVSSPNGNESVYSLRLWRYAERHVLQDSALGPAWKALTDRIAERQTMRQALDRLHDDTVESALRRELGPGWVGGTGFGTPQAPRWYNTEVFWNWVRSRRDLGPITDEKMAVSYGRADIPNETRYLVNSGGLTMLSSSDDDGPRADKCRKVMAELQSDASLRRLQDELEQRDQSLSAQAEGLRALAAEFYERTVESKKIVGICPVCP